MQKNKFANIANVFKDIINIKFTQKQTLQDIIKDFYRIMRKYGIKKGTMDKKGIITYDNYEWTACWKLFLDSVEYHLKCEVLFRDIPKDLQYYK